MKTVDNQTFLQNLKDVECPDATFPARPPLVFAKAQGSKIWDVEGREYLDLCAGFGALPFGHNPTYLLEVFRSQGDQIVHGLGDVYPSTVKIQLLDRLVNLAPAHLRRGSLALTGSQAVEIAIKTALLTTKKQGFIALEGAYHGLDLGVLAFSGRDAFREPFSSWVAESYVERVPLNFNVETLEQARQRLQSRGADLAAMIVEPIQGRGGCCGPGLEALQLARSWSLDVGALLIFDEVFTGFGRCGSMWFAEAVPCDLLCLGKALGGGMPISACLGTEETLGSWPQSTGEALHTGTFFGHPLSCRVAEATLSQLTADDGFLPEVRTKGSQALAVLREGLTGNATVVDIRGEGLMLAVEFAKSGSGGAAMDLLRSHGIIALASGHHGECLGLTPALNVPKAELLDGVERVVRVLNDELVDQLQ